MQTTQCPRCRHTFLSYAAECPECGCKRPLHSRFKRGPKVALLVSVLALAATILMVKSVIQSEIEPVAAGRAKGQSGGPPTSGKFAQTSARTR